MIQIPIARPLIGKEESEFVLDAVTRTELSGTAGAYIGRFEREFAQYCGAQHAITASNGTTALHLTIAALGITSGDEVLVATFTNMASVFAICYAGATPVAVDIERDTWNLDPSLLESRLTSRTKAIMVVHIYGHPVDMDPVMEIARKHSLFVIEDAAEAHGAEYKGRRVGSLGDIAAFSFYANKIVTTGEGGMVVTNSKALAQKVRSLGSLAYGPPAHRFMHTDIGFNYRMPNLVAAVGCAQMTRVGEVIGRKRELAHFYLKELSGIDTLRVPVERDYARNVYWMFHVVLQGRLAGKRQEVTGALRAAGIETRDAFIPFNQQEVFIRSGLARSSDCPVANDVAENGFYIPSGPVISDDERHQVADVLRRICR